MTKAYLAWALVLCVPSAAFAQGWPAVSSNAPSKITANNTAPYTIDDAYVSFRNKAGLLGGDDLYGLPSYNMVETRVDVPAGTTVQGVNGFAAYLKARTPSLGESGNVSGFFAVTNAMVNNAHTWGINTVNNTTDPNGRGKWMTGYEADFGVASPFDQIRGVGVFGNTPVAFDPSTPVDAFEVGSLSQQQLGLARWKRGFLCTDAAMEHFGACLDIGLNELGGPNVGGPNINFWFTDGNSLKHAYSIHTQSNHLYFDSDLRGTNGVVFEVPIYPLAKISLQPEAASGTNIASPVLQFTYFGSDSVSHLYSQHVHTDGNFYFDDDRHGTNRIIFEVGTRFDGAVEIPFLASGTGAGSLVCINNLSGALYKATGTTC